MPEATIPMNDLKRGAGWDGDALQEALARVLRSGWYVLGPEVRAFEAEFAEYCGTAHCVGVASGTDALELALRAVGVERGEVVVTAGNAGAYTSTAALAIGADLRFADVDPRTHVVTAQTVGDVLAPGVRCVVVTHLYGRLADDTERIVAMCRSKGVAVIEDCAQATGARRDGRSAGSFGDAGTFSFYPTKNLGALGDGGAVVTSQDGIAEQLRLRRQYGWRERYVAGLAGGRNSRLDEMQAAVLRARLPQLQLWNARRREIVAAYADAMPAQVGEFAGLPGEDYVAHLAVAVLQVDRDAFRSFMARSGVATDVHYPVPDYRQPAIAAVCGHDPQSTPATQWLSSRIVTLPCFPELTDAEVGRVRAALAASASLVREEYARGR